MAHQANSEINRMLWRYNMGYYQENLFVERLENEVSDLLTSFSALNQAISALRWRPTQLIEAFDNAINSARNSSYGRDYKEAVKQIEESQRSLFGLREGIAANAGYESASSAYKDINELVRFAPLTHLITFKSIAQLLAESSRLLKAERYRQARVLARICNDRIVAIQTRNSDPQKAKRLLADINRLGEMSYRTRAFVPDEQDDPLGVEAIEGLRSLAADHRLDLVEALVNDLESEFASRRAFLSIYEQRVKASAESATYVTGLLTELRRNTSAWSWDVASQHILRGVLTNVSSRTQSFYPRLIKASEELSKMLSTQPNAS